MTSELTCTHNAMFEGAIPSIATKIMTLNPTQLEIIRERAVEYFMEFPWVRSIEIANGHLRIGISDSNYASAMPTFYEAQPGLSIKVTYYVRPNYRVGGKK